MSIHLKSFILSVFVDLIVILTLALFGIRSVVFSSILGMVSYLTCLHFIEKLED